MTRLAAIATSELQRLVIAIERGAVSAPLRAAELQAEGLPGSELLAVLDGLSRATLLRLLRALIADRELRAPPHLELVWTGPEVRGATSRDTAVLVRELFAGARESVLIAGFSFDHGQEIFAPLHAVMAAYGVRSEIYIDIREPARSGAAPAEHARAYAIAFLTKNWPFGAPLPAVHYDPRGAEPRANASLHAKCIVVDVARTLITSANFTDRGQTRNIELGVLIEDRDFAARVVSQWRSLAEAGLLATLSR